MPKKLHRRKYKRQIAHSPEVIQSVTHPLEPAVKPMPGTKQTLTADERRVTAHQYARLDLKRSLIIGGFVIILLIIVCFILRYSPIGILS